MIIKTTETELKIDMLDTHFVSNWKEYMNRINQPSFSMHQWFITGWPWEPSEDDSIDVNLYNCLLTVSGSTFLLKSIETLIPSLLDSSLISLIPSIFLSLTSSAILSFKLDLLIW